MKGQIIRERYEATCDSYDQLYRAEQYEKYFVALREIKPRGVVLDAGCGTGLLAEFMYAYGLLDDIERYICLDYSSCMLSIAAWRLGVLCADKCVVVMGDVQDLSLRDKSVDVTYSFTVLDLLDDPERGIEEILRVTRGRAVVSLMKALSLKDKLITRHRFIGSTAKDVILELRRSHAPP
ncbi:MAG: class I SAM-dependent methyltransferase [Acidilobaceae archaeon]|nr:class I SAM-dependent methyltransferase [Acidilobaceae archaeon]